MTALVHHAPGATAFDERLRLARPDRIAASRSAGADRGLHRIPPGVITVSGRFRAGTGSVPVRHPW
ncbi:hypothetical protein [Streptomyces albogriseolus]|uniref:hypothetical protein n=1 Tax=Streptomyces albogriseolus TaxID=1887 RepID=UPI003F53EF1A